jgi:hypothetical protein
MSSSSGLLSRKSSRFLSGAEAIMLTNVVAHMFSHSIQLNLPPRFACFPESFRRRNTIARKADRISKQIERNLKLMRHLFGCRALRQNFHFGNCCFSLFFFSGALYAHKATAVEVAAERLRREWKRLLVLREKTPLGILLIIHTDVVRLGVMYTRTPGK